MAWGLKYLAADIRKVKIMAKALKNDALMEALKKRQEFLNSLPPDKRKKMIEFQKEIDEALDKVPENERLELIYGMMMNKLNELKEKLNLLQTIIKGN